jgi:hypothetical protein
MESQAQFCRSSITDYVGLLTLAILTSVLAILFTIPLVVIVSVTGWQMFFVFLANLAVIGTKKHADN